MLEQTGAGHGQRALQEGWLDVVLGPSTPARRPKLERAKLYEDRLVYLRAGEAGLAQPTIAPSGSRTSPPTSSCWSTTRAG